jgi:Protein of unknown function (DUF4089)
MPNSQSLVIMEETKKINETEQDKLNTYNYVIQTASLMDLDLKDEYRNGVVTNFQKVEAIAKLVNEFPLPEDVQVVTKFEP